MQLKIDRIKVKNRQRELGDIDALCDSIGSIGLINPISVTEDFRLVAGLHRLEACKALGWLEIPAVVLSLDDIAIQLAEIDENLIRNELSVLERGEQLKKRKELYEVKYPETKAGNAQAIGMNKALNNNVSAESAPTFVKDVAAKTHKSARVISEDIQIASRIAAPVRDAIRHTPLADHKGELLALTQLDGDTQAKIAEKIVSGEVASVNQAINKLYPNPPKIPPQVETKSLAWVSRVISYNDGFKLISERDGGIVNLTKNWSTSSKEEFLDALETIVKNYGNLAAELGEIIANEK